MAKLTAKDFIESLKEMKLTEINELVEAMVEEFGIDLTAVAAAPAAGGDAPAAGGEDAPVSVLIQDAGTSKVEVIKIIRELTGLGLMESKAIADAAGGVVKENIARAEAEDIKTKLEEAGATVEIK